jgi:hypothetical protein
MKTHNVWPVLKQVQKVMEYECQKKACTHTNKNTTIIKSLHNLLQTPVFKPYIATPKRGE